MTKRAHRHSDGKFHVSGKTYSELVGSRTQVWHGTAYKTAGGLTKTKLHKNKHGRYVSKSKFLSAKKEKRLEKHGYFAVKGKFGYVKKGDKRKTVKRKSGKRKSGKRKK